MKYRKCFSCGLTCSISWTTCPRCDKPLIEWEGEVCQKCLNPYRIGCEVPDDIWNKIVENKNLLCIDCFDEIAERKNIKYKAKIYWAGFGEIIKEE